jgi:hypothetical protein
VVIFLGKKGIIQYIQYSCHGMSTASLMLHEGGIASRINLVSSVAVRCIHVLPLFTSKSPSGPVAMLPGAVGA